MRYISSIERIGRQEGRLEEIRNLMPSFLKVRFGILDESLLSIIEPLAHLPVDEIAHLVLNSSREDLLARFGQILALESEPCRSGRTNTLRHHGQ